MDENTAAMIYIGPASMKLGLKRYGVYSNGLPSHVESLCEKYPGLKEYFVPVEEFASTGVRMSNDEYKRMAGFIRDIEGGKA